MVCCVCVCVFFCSFFQEHGTRSGRVGGTAYPAESGVYIFQGLFCSLSVMVQNSLSEGLGPSLLSNHHLLNTPIPNNLEGAHILCYS